MVGANVEHVDEFTYDEGLGAGRFATNAVTLAYNDNGNLLVERVVVKFNRSEIGNWVRDEGATVWQVAAHALLHELRHVQHYIACVNNVNEERRVRIAVPSGNPTTLKTK